MTGIIAMDYFQYKFQTGQTGTQVAVIFSLYTVWVHPANPSLWLWLMCIVSSGSIVGAPFAAILTDKFGRRKAMFAGGVVVIVGVVIISSSSTVAQFVVGRFILGLGIAVMTVAAPAYAMEISPPQWRGRCTGSSCPRVVV